MKRGASWRCGVGGRLSGTVLGWGLLMWPGIRLVCPAGVLMGKSFYNVRGWQWWQCGACTGIRCRTGRGLPSPFLSLGRVGLEAKTATGCGFGQKKRPP